MARRGTVLVAATVLLGACTSTTGGSGVAAPAVGSGSTIPSTSPSAAPTGPGSDSGSGSAPGSAEGSTPAGPSTAAAPSVCARQDDCVLVKSWDVGGGYVVAAFSAPGGGGGTGSSVLLLARDQRPVYWHVFDGESPSELLCKVAGPLRNCALVDLVGAHGASAYPFVVVDDRLLIGTPVGSDTPGLHVADLNGDLLVDAYGLQNDYRPDYARGHVQWQTWKRSADAATLVSTGCGPLSSSAPVDPTRFQTGKCAGG